MYYKYIDINYELFNIGSDSQKFHNLIEENSEQLKKLNKILDDWIKSKLKKESAFQKD